MDDFDYPAEDCWSFVATYRGQAVGWCQADEGAGFIGAIVGAIIVLVVWGMIAPRFERT